MRPVGIGDNGGSGVDKGTCGAVAYGHANLLAPALWVVSREIEIVLAFLLDDAGCPGIARGPLHLIAFHIEHFAFVGPVDEVGRGEYAEVMTAPAGCAVGGAVDVVFLGLGGVEHLGVGMESAQDGLLIVGESLQQTFLLGAGDRDDGAMTWGELALHLGVLHKLEGFQVFRTAELIVTVAVAVVHDNP